MTIRRAPMLGVDARWLRQDAGLKSTPAMRPDRDGRIVNVSEQVVKADKPTLSDKDFKAELALTIPHLRAYGRSLSGNRDVADDLVQETMLKAWAARKRFEAGTNMRAWTFIILRNIFLSQMRRAKFTRDWEDSGAERMLTAPADQHDQIHLADVRRALAQLPDAQREALILVGAGGFSYEEAAQICDVALGTIKSRVARARAALEQLINSDEMTPRTEDNSESNEGDALSSILDEVDLLSGDRVGEQP